MANMKTTLSLNRTLLQQLRREAAQKGTTMSALVETALRLMFLERSKPKKKLRPLPTFDSGGALVDVADRDRLYDAMEGR